MILVKKGRRMAALFLSGNVSTKNTKAREEKNNTK
jgi:hypothetical protein